MYKLLIAAQPNERQMIRMLVGAYDTRITSILECTTGQDVLRLCLTEHPDICIMNMSFSDADGLSVLERIRQDKLDTQIILIADAPDINQTLTALRLGASDIWIRPLQRGAAQQTFSRVLSELDETHRRQTEKRFYTDMRYVLEKRILRELVTGQSEAETLWLLDNLGIESTVNCCAYYWKLLQCLDEEQKMELAYAIRAKLQDIGQEYFLYVHKTSIDLLIFNISAVPDKAVDTDIEEIFAKALSEYGYEGEFAAGEWCHDVFQLEYSYAEARRKFDSEPAKPSLDLIAKNGNKNSAQMKRPPEVVRICQYIEENYAEKLTLESIAREVGYSKFYAGRIFKQATGITIIDYVINVRLDRAKELLSSSEKSIKQISYMVGYQDPNYFTWSFKKYLGMTPVQYRYYQNGNG